MSFLSRGARSKLSPLVQLLDEVSPTTASGRLRIKAARDTPVARLPVSRTDIVGEQFCGVCGSEVSMIA